MKTYAFTVLILMILLMVVGIFAPRLISAPSTEAVALGFALLLLLPIVVTLTVRRWWKTEEAKSIAKKILPVVLLAIMLGACSKVPAGNVGVWVYLLGSSKGVDVETVGPGRYWVGINEELYLFPTFTQNYVWTQEPTEGSPNDESITFQTVEGLSVNTDIGISYHIDPDKAAAVFQKYRKGISEITDIYLRNRVRDALVEEASVLTVESVYGKGKAGLMKRVEERVRKEVDPLGIKIENLYWIGKVRLPETVVRALDEKISATQKAQQRENEIAEKRAEAKKKIETAKGEAESIRIQAEAQAKANQTLAASITSELVLYRAIDRWDGVLPKFTGQSAVPFMNLESLKAGESIRPKN